METLRFTMVTTHYPPNHLGGDAVFVEYLSRELIRLGHEVHIMTFPGAFSLLRRPVKPIDVRAGHMEIVHQFDPVFPRITAFSTLVAGTQSAAKRHINKLFRTLKPDVVHWHNTKGFIGRAFSVRSARNLYTAHDYFPICPRSNLLRPDYSICSGPYNCMSCHLKWRKPPPLWRIGPSRVVTFDGQFSLISPSEFLARRFSESGISITRVIRNFVPRPSRLLNPAGNPDNTILYIGMLEAHKGLTTTIKGFAMSKNRHGFKLKIIGDGRMKDHLVKAVSELDVKDRVEILGYVSRDALEELRSKASFQIVPSEWAENAPLTAIEALSTGLPLIVSDQGGLQEITCPEDTALTFRGGDETSLGDCLIRAWESAERTGEMRMRAKRRYEAFYTPEKHLTDYLDLIKGPESIRP